MTNTPCLTLVLIGTGKKHSGKLPVGNHKNKLANHVGQGHTERNEMRNQIYENSYK